MHLPAQTCFLGLEGFGGQTTPRQFPTQFSWLQGPALFVLGPNSCSFSHGEAAALCMSTLLKPRPTAERSYRNEGGFLSMRLRPGSPADQPTARHSPHTFRRTFPLGSAVTRGRGECHQPTPHRFATAPAPKGCPEGAPGEEEGLLGERALGNPA